MHTSLAMASGTPMISHSQSLFFKRPKFTVSIIRPQPHFFSSFSLKKSRISVVISGAARAGEKPEKKLEEETRFTALRMHTKDEVKEGEREPDGPPISKWEPNVKGYLQFLVDSSLAYDILERAVEEAAFPEYAELRNTGLERSKSLGKDLEWFKQQGHFIPQPSSVGINYAQYIEIEELSEKDPQAFVFHLYMIYFGHTAGGTTIGRKVEKTLLKGKELEFYKYDGELPKILQNARDKLNRIGEGWSRKEKDRCLAETEKSMMLYGNVLRLALS